MALSSASNSQFKKLLSLWTSKGIKEHRLALVCGQKLVDEVCRRIPERIEFVISESDSEAHDKYKVIVLTPALFRKLDQLGTKHKMVVVRLEPALEADFSAADSHLILPLQNPDNLGAAIRSALAFGIDSVVLTAESANPFLPKAIRSSSGSVFDINICKIDGPVKQLQIPRQRFVALDGAGTELEKIEWPQSPVFCVGTEGPGGSSLPEASTRCKIPIEPSIESLNATVALSIVLYEWRRVTKK